MTCGSYIGQSHIQLRLSHLSLSGDCLTRHFLEFHALGNVQDISGLVKDSVQYRAKHQEIQNPSQVLKCPAHFLRRGTPGNVGFLLVDIL